MYSLHLKILVQRAAASRKYLPLLLIKNEAMSETREGERLKERETESIHK